MLIFLTSCSNDSETSSFELSQTSFALNKPQQTISVHISSNSSWQAINIPTWITLQQTQGNGNADLQIVVSQNNNPDGQTRTGVIEFISDNKVYTLTIVQTALNDITISILNNEVHHLDYNQHVITIQVSSTKPWFIDLKPDWVMINPSMGNAGITNVEITVPENNTNVFRTGFIRFLTETPIINDGTWTNLDFDQTFNAQNPNYVKTWNPTNQIISGDYRYNLELKNNKLFSTVFLTFNTPTIGSKAYFESYDGVSWNGISGITLYGTKLKLAISNSGALYTSYITGSFNTYQYYASAIMVSDISTPITSDFVSPSTVDYTDVALTNNNEMVLVYNDNGNNGKISVKQKIGSSWQILGTQGFSVGAASHCNIAVNSNNEIYVAYSDAGVSNKIVVKKYNGSSWDTVGQLGFSSSGAENIEMEIGSNNEIFVAFKDLANMNKITVKKYSSGNWQTIGTEGLSNFSINSVSLALDSQNLPYIAYIEDTNGNNPVIKKFDGSSWVDLNRIKIEDGGNFVTTASELRIIVGSDNIPFIAMKCSLGVILAKYIN